MITQICKIKIYQISGSQSKGIKNFPNKGFDNSNFLAFEVSYYKLWRSRAGGKVCQ
jgi:hypothetical protein